jgi:hypothetical protein
MSGRHYHHGHVFGLYVVDIHLSVAIDVLLGLLDRLEFLEKRLDALYELDATFEDVPSMSS